MLFYFVCFLACKSENKKKKKTLNLRLAACKVCMNVHGPESGEGWKISLLKARGSTVK